MTRSFLSTGARSIFVALLVGVWSLLGQFVFNRIIFFYVANSEYAAASIISIHLAGFWIGTLISRNRRLNIPLLVVLSFGATWLARLVTWQIGAAWLGLELTVLSAVTSGMLLAILSGGIVVQLMDQASGEGKGVVVADSAGSVLGAFAGGFVLVPIFGLGVTFTAVLALQCLALIASGAESDWRPKFLIAVALMTGMIPILVPPPSKPSMVYVDGMPVNTQSRSPASVLFEERSPYGVVSVIEKERAQERVMFIDNRALCGTHIRGQERDSEWAVGANAVRMIPDKDRKVLRVLNIGLGCGTTLSAILTEVKSEDRVDVVEINSSVVLAQKLFQSMQQHDPDSENVKVIVEDGFNYVARWKGQPRYDAIVIDLAWMHNMNATHLFSQEMYENAARYLAQGGVLALWSEETNPFSPVALIIYRTLRETYRTVIVDSSQNVMLFYATNSGEDLIGYMPKEVQRTNKWIVEASAGMPINRLDNLVMNRYKFNTLGDSGWERLSEKYSTAGMLSKASETQP